MRTKIKVLKGALIAFFVFLLAVGAFVFTSGAAEQEEKTVYFSTAEEFSVENGAADTRGVAGVAVTLHNVANKDKVSVDYLNYIAKSELSGEFLELAFLPETVKKADFDYALITLVDAADENQKLVYAVAPQPDTAAWWYSWSAAWIGYSDDVEPVSSVKFQFNSMLKLAGTEQYLMGYNQSFINPDHIYYTGPYMEVGYNLGAKNQFFVQENENSALDSLTFSLSGSSARINGNQIADLTDEDFMQASNAMLTNTAYENLYSPEYFENLFSSGYCKLKITFMGCKSENLTFHIRKIGGQWIENNPQEGVVNASPYFAIEHVTHAVDGLSFLLPEKTVVDFREGDLSDKAQYTFLTATGQTLQYEGNAIVFPGPGEYEMRCSVRLENGDLFSTSRTVTCYDKMPKTQFTTAASFAERYKTGDALAVASAAAVNDLSTKSGKRAEVSVYLQIDGVEEYVFSADEYGYFVLEKPGNYVLSYLHQNAYGVVDALSYAFVVEESLGIFPEFVPVTLTSAAENRIADFEVVNYVDERGFSEIYRAAYVNDTLVYLAKGNDLLQGSYVFDGTLSEASATLTYKAGFSEEEMIYQKSSVIPVIAPQYAEDYIVQYDKEGFARTAGTISSPEEIILTTDKDLGFMLPQVLPADGLEFAFDVKAGGTYGRVNVLLRDYGNENKQIKFSLTVNDAVTSLLYVNGKYESTINGSLINDNSYFQWRFDGTGNMLCDQAGNVLTKRITAWEDGTPFDGFENGICVLSFELEGVESETAFALKKVNNQPFFTTEIGGVKQRFTDLYSPIILLAQEPDFESLTLGSRAQVPSAIAYDVLSPASEIRVSVVNPEGAKIFDGAECHAPLSFSVDVLGRWSVEYTAHDGNELFLTQQRYNFNIKDKSAPKIYVNGTVPSSAEKGKETEFPAAFVFDNVTQNCPYYIVIIEPDGMRRIAKDNKFTFTKEGKYIVQYYAYDDSMNDSQMNFEITVS